MKRYAVGRILVATDLSKSAPALLSVGANVAKTFGAELIVLHVLDPEDYAKILTETATPLDAYIDRLRAEMRGHLAAATGSNSLGPTRLEVVAGRYTSYKILTEADRLGVDLIVIGTHGRTGLRRALLGSVAEDVLRAARIPVLVAPMGALEALAEPTATDS